MSRSRKPLHAAIAVALIMLAVSGGRLRPALTTAGAAEPATTIQQSMELSMDGVETGADWVGAGLQVTRAPVSTATTLANSPLIGTTSVPATTATPAGAGFEVYLREVELTRLPGQVDSNSPAFWDGNQLVLFNSAEHPVRSSGPSLEALAVPVAVTCENCQRPGGRWLEAVWRDPTSGILYGWYHFEPSDLACQTAPIVGAVLSWDGGRTWVDQGAVLESSYPIDCTYQNGFFVGGNGDFHVIPDQEHGYFYFLFSSYAGPIAEQGIGIARSAFADRGHPGTTFKYFDGAWEEPGLGGRVTPLFPSTTGWSGPEVEAFWGPSVHWNDYLETYIALLNHTNGTDWQQEGIYITFSADLLHWSTPERLLDSEVWYPQVMGVGPQGTDTRAGQTARIYVGGVSTVAIEFVAIPVA